MQHGNPYGRSGYGARTPLGTPVPVGSGRPPQVLQPVGGRRPVPGASDGEYEQTRLRFNAQRVIEAGGRVSSEILPPEVTPFEQLYRRLPQEGMFEASVSPQRPFKFELGAFVVPPRTQLFIFDIRPDVYRFSGVDPGDYVPVETRRFGSIMGFDLTVNQQHRGNISFELDPVPIQFSSQQAFVSGNTMQPSANPSQQAVAASSSFASAAGPGNALQPQRPERYGALSIPWTIFAKAGEVVQASCVIFRPIPSPIAFIEYDLAGLLVPELWGDQIVRAVQPPLARGPEQAT